MNLIETLSKNELILCQKHKYKKGTIIFHEDDECLYIGLVKKGIIHISSYTLSGQEIIYNEIGENGLFGNNLLFSKEPYYKGNVIAKTDAEIFLISKDNLLKILQSNIEFTKLYLSIQADFSKNLNGKIKLLSLTSSEERFLYFLQENNPLVFTSITSLADSLFLTRETTSRLISKLTKEGRIKRMDKKLVLLK